MSLKIPIDHSKLLDSPFDGNNKALFEFSYSDTEAFVQDVINGNRTCYLISGYRGAGKSSLIKKIEVDIKKEDKNVLFVYLNFAKHEPRSILLRKLIRNFYLHLTDKEENKPLYKRLSEKKALQSSLIKFYELYERTFFEVSKNSNERKSKKTTSLLGYNANLKDLIFTIGAILSFVASLVGFNPTVWQTYLLVGATVFLNVLQFYSLERKKEKEESNSSETSKNSFYDDEIAEYYLLEILTLFKEEIKPIFILDELDKINNDELLENIINELKPIMLSGLASFIVVAGQDLYYNYHNSHTKDDNPLSTLFSKVFHVPLLSVAELKLIFNKLIRINLSELNEEENGAVDAYLNYMIFQSKRVPRRFITLIRQNLVWSDNNAFLEIDVSKDKWLVYTQVLERIKAIDDKVIAARNFPSPIRDYFNMQLFIKSHRILGYTNSFTLENIYEQ